MILEDRHDRGKASLSEPRSGGDDPYIDEPKYPAWKVSLFVIVVCGAFWAGVSYLAVRLFG